MDFELQDDETLDGDEEELVVREWRRQRLESLGVSELFASLFADRVDWHEIARLVDLGCPPPLAIDILR